MAATLTRDGEVAQTWFSIPIEKVEEDADGDLIVWGKATDGSVDSDEQIIDPDFSAKALQEWLDTAGNVRVQHQAMRDPAGKGLNIETSPDGHYVKSLVVEPVAQRLVKKGVLTAYSVGIARPTIVRDGVARGGRITGGQIVEISLVDRPANKNCGIQLVKAAKDGGPEWVGKVWGADDILEKSERTDNTVSIDLPGDVSVSFSPSDLAKVIAARAGNLEKRNFDRNVGGGVDRDKLGEGDFAGRNRSFPIVTAGDVSDALHSIGRAGSDNYDAATLRANILRIARRKGFPVPDSAKKPSKKAKKAMKNAEAEEMIQQDLAAKAEEDAELVLKEGSGSGTDSDDCDDDKDDMGKAAKKKLPPWLKDKDGDGDDDDDDDDDDKSSKSVSGFTPEVSAAMRYKSLGVPYELGMIHDYTCPAFDPSDVEKCHPMGGLNTMNDGYWQQQAIDMASGGSLEMAKNYSVLWGYAQTLKQASPSDLFVLRQQMHKAFQDANPGVGHAPVPSGQIHPNSYNRPYISAGHAAASSGQESPNSAKVPMDSLQPGQFTRGPVTAGHAATDSNYSTRASSVSPPTETGRVMPTNWGSVPRDNLQAAMGVLHDHITDSALGLCPLKPAAVSTPVPAPSDTPSPSAAKTAEAEKAIAPDGPPKKGKKLPKPSGPPSMSSSSAAEVAEPDVEKSVAAYMEKMISSLPPAEQPAPITQDDIRSSVQDVLVEMLREEPVTQADVKKAVGAAIKKAMAAQAPAVEPVSPDQIREIIRKEIDDSLNRPEPLTSADLNKAIAAAVDAAQPKVEPEPSVTKADLKKAVASAVRKSVSASTAVMAEALSSLPVPTPPPVVEPVVVEKEEPEPAIDYQLLVKEATAPLLARLEAQEKAPQIDYQQLVADATSPLMARIEAQDRMLRKQEKSIRKARQDEMIRQQPPMPDVESLMEKVASTTAMQVQAAHDGQPIQPPGLTRDDLAAFTQPLFQRLEMQEKLIRKQEKRLEKQQLKAFMDSQTVPGAVSPTMSAVPAQPEISREMIAELTAQLQSQPGVSEDIIKQVTGPLIERLEAQEKLLQDRITRDDENSPLLAKLDAHEKMLRKQSKSGNEALQAITERLETQIAAQPDIAKSAVAEATSPLLARLEAQEEMLRKQQKKLRKAQEQREQENSIAALREQMLNSAGPQMRSAVVKGSSLTELSVPLLDRMQAQEKLIRKQQKQLAKQQKQLSSLPDIAKAVDAMAGLPDPALAPFKGLANNIFKTPLQNSGLPVGAQGVADVAERTQAMMLRELEEQFRTTSDPAQREAAWKTIVKMRGLPEGTNPF